MNKNLNLSICPSNRQICIQSQSYHILIESIILLSSLFLVGA
uniref:Uncharacterized protein n=1 Tax=Anguilla anguilla TaxID=7936 RepID=A0A0E9X2P0_ANGAN